jgi:hypothetical protein
VAESADLEEVVLVVAIVDLVAEVFADLEVVISEVRDLVEVVEIETETVEVQTAVREVQIAVREVQIDQVIEDVNTIQF